MRSEKEIRKALKAHTFYAKAGTQGFINSKNLLEWVLEGEPRYSVAEIDALLAFYGKLPNRPSSFLAFLYDKKRISSILNEKGVFGV